jgi:hypothetical protein
LPLARLEGLGSLQNYCTPKATFAAQAEPLADIKTLAEYADWMKGVTTAMPDSSYEVKSFATDAERNNVAAYAVFSGAHSDPGGPCEPTGKKTASDYVYVMQFTGDKISHVTKIWNSGMALKELGWLGAASLVTMAAPRCKVNAMIRGDGVSWSARLTHTRYGVEVSRIDQMSPCPGQVHYC